MSQKIRGIKKIKTSQKSGLSSKPKVENYEYMELYLMTKKRDRLRCYHEAVSNARKSTAEEIEEVEQEFKQLEKKMGINRPDSRSDVKAAASVSRQHKKKRPAKPMKTMVFDY